jgi:hypothetical protein
VVPEVGRVPKKECIMAKSAKKKPAKKKLTLRKETVRKLTDKATGKVAALRQDSYQTCNMKCNSDPSACGC